MPVDYYRADIRFPLDISTRLNVLLSGIQKESGRKISKSNLVVEIVRLFLDNNEKQEHLLSLQEDVERRR